MNEDKRLELKKEIAKGLLDIEAVFPASGRSVYLGQRDQEPDLL